MTEFPFPELILGVVVFVVFAALSIMLALHRSGPRCICGRPTVMRTCPREVDARGHRPALCGRCNRIGGAR